MWRYEQITGRMLNDSGTLVGVGYSGAGLGKNNPTMEDLHDVGPIPCGTYSISAPVDTVDHGPYVLGLTPDPANEMFGRSGFLIHGDNMHAPGTASEGCVIQSRDVREQIWASMDHTLQVVAGPLTEAV